MIHDLCSLFQSKVLLTLPGRIMLFLMDDFTHLELEVCLDGLRELQVAATKEIKLVTRSLLPEENSLKKYFLNRFF